MIHRKISLSSAFAGILTCLASAALCFGADEAVKLTQQEDRVRVEINGVHFTDYVFKGANHVYYYPIMGPNSTPMTRNYPMKPDAPNEEHDHIHHRSLWFSHGAVNGIDFWAETPKSGKIVHDKFIEVKSGATEGVIRSANKWVALDGKVVCTDERTFRVYARPNNERMFDFEITFFAPKDQEVILGDTKEGSMAIRVAETMRVTQPKKQKGEGHIVLSTGIKDEKAWSNRAEWCDYYGPVNGKTVGVAIFNNPSNPGHPTYWHVRDYGLFAANPFGAHDFEKKPAGAGNMVIAPGKSLTFKYRFYFHEGDENQAKVAERYKEYATPAAK